MGEREPASIWPVTVRRVAARLLVARLVLIGRNASAEDDVAGKLAEIRARGEPVTAKDLAPPLVVTDASSQTNVTLIVDVDSWFRRDDGQLVDPATAEPGPWLFRA